eukprot:TRINITY_DN13389_c0_g1_i1.p1 TRINITY_DN13389_c0_g1~~TRINITY_DN13389_c0_g1_i1.p1  ORF type:complete len:580 (-),score=133.94 TRINITY_DN13389_c0_g1_i1:81-1820(-)
MERGDARQRTFTMNEIDQPSSIHVLLVDDEKISLMLAQKLLRQCLYQVSTASDGKEAFAMLLAKPTQFSVVISDVYMPDVDGFELLTKIRNTPQLADTPVVMISAAQDLDVVVKCLRSGADDFIVKPARLEVMQTVWQSVWRKRKERKMLSMLSLEQHSRGELMQQVDRLTTQVNEAVETPINVILQTITNLSRIEGLTTEVREALSVIFKSLGSSNLYRPAIQKAASVANADGTTRDWLSSTLGVESPAEEQPVNQWPEVSNVIERKELRNWDFDVWSYKEEGLLNFLKDMFSDFGLMERFNISEVRLKSFLLAVRAQYNSKNPYHNFRHAFDVTHAVYVCLTQGQGAARLLTHLDIFAVLVAALLHDIDHPGTNNAFQMATASKLAIRYNDRSVLENHHCAHGFKLLLNEDNNIIAGLSPADYKDFRSTVISCILATDLALHMEYQTKFAALVDGTYDKDRREDRLLLVQLLLKSADISNTCKRYELAKYWSDMVQEEFYQQGDNERRKGMSVSAFMDRSHRQQARMSINFIDFIVAPFYKKLIALLPEMQFAVDYLTETRKKWVVILAEEQASAES